MSPQEFEDYLDWTEIMTGPEMAAWIQTNDPAQYIEMQPGIFWLRPDLYVWWKLRYR